MNLNVLIGLAMGLNLVALGSSRLPSPVVPSAKSTMTSPFTRRWARAWVTSFVAFLRWRSMKTERWSLAKYPITGQVSTSDLAMKESG